MFSSNVCKFPGAPFEISVLIILLCLIAYTCGDATISYAMEGEEIQLDFSYPCESAQVTLRLGYSTPFYDSANPETNSLPENQELKVHNAPESDNCYLQLKINPVKRSDKGGYILTSYDNDQNYLEDTRIGLRVDHPPGMASCEWSAENIVDKMDEWGSMLCKAPAGSTRGQITCYQNGIRLPPQNTPTETGNILQQAIWVRYSQIAFCCASRQGELIAKCACKDYVWDPFHKRNITDPCAAFFQVSTSPKSPEEGTKTTYSAIATSTPTTLNITKRPAPKINISIYGTFSVTTATLIFVIIIQCVVCTAAFRQNRQKNREIMKHKAWSTLHAFEQNDPKSVQTVEV